MLNMRDVKDMPSGHELKLAPMAKKIIGNVLIFAGAIGIMASVGPSKAPLYVILLLSVSSFGVLIAGLKMLNLLSPRWQ